MSAISSGFAAFGQEAPEVAAAHFAFVRAHAEHTALDPKTEELAYLAVIAALRLPGGLAFHVAQAKQLGASRDEVVSALLVGLPAAGLAVMDALPVALEAYDRDQSPSS